MHNSIHSVMYIEFVRFNIIIVTISLLRSSIFRRSPLTLFRSIAVSVKCKCSSRTENAKKKAATTTNFFFQQHKLMKFISPINSNLCAR